MKGMAHKIKCSEKVLCASIFKIYQLFSLNDHIQAGEFSNQVDLDKNQTANVRRLYQTHPLSVTLGFFLAVVSERSF